MISDIIERIKHIDALIQENKTGTPADLAKAIGVSERTIHRTIKRMRILGAPINYNYLKKTYYYKEEGSFTCEIFFSLKVKASNHNSPFKSIKEYLAIINPDLMINNN